VGRIAVEAEVSLDGVMNGRPDEFWGQIFQSHSDDVTEYLSDLLSAATALLMGRNTYQVFAEVWPTREGKDADTINSMRKYVASRTLNEPLAWNATLIKGDAAEEIGKLKRDAGQGLLLQYGVGELTQTMLKHGLVDELRILVYPFTRGSGPRMFENMDSNALKLIETRTFSSGVIALHYQTVAS
jgi:dihydrofolate reductase